MAKKIPMRAPHEVLAQEAADWDARLRSPMEFEDVVKDASVRWLIEMAKREDDAGGFPMIGRPMPEAGRRRDPDAWLRKRQPTAEMCRLIHGIDCTLGCGRMDPDPDEDPPR